MNRHGPWSKAYAAADEKFHEVYQRFLDHHENYKNFEAAIEKNLGIVTAALEEAKTLQNVTVAAKEKFLATARCEPSSICCQKAEDVPEICERDAKGEVAKFTPKLDVTFKLKPPFFTTNVPTPTAAAIAAASKKGAKELQDVQAPKGKTSSQSSSSMGKDEVSSEKSSTSTQQMLNDEIDETQEKLDKYLNDPDFQLMY